MSSDRSALVTGASRGIGLAIAERLAGSGYDLTISSRSAADLEALIPRLRKAGASRVVGQAADMADHDTLPELVSAHRDAFGTMSCLVVNAGVGTAGEVATFPVRRIAKTLDVNLAAAIILTRSSLPLLRAAAAADAQVGARIIGLASLVGVFAEPSLAVYGASKAALISFLEAVNAEESGRGVMATAIAPGYVRTEMSTWKTGAIPADRMITVDDVVTIVHAVLQLSPTTSITRVVMSRSGTSGFVA